MHIDTRNDLGIATSFVDDAASPPLSTPYPHLPQNNPDVSPLDVLVQSCIRVDRAGNGGL